MGFSSNFISNVNLMILPLLLCPFLALILKAMNNKSDCYKKKPQYEKYSYVCFLILDPSNNSLVQLIQYLWICCDTSPVF